MNKNIQRFGVNKENINSHLGYIVPDVRVREEDTSAFIKSLNDILFGKQGDVGDLVNMLRFINKIPCNIFRGAKTINYLHCDIISRYGFVF